MNGVGQADLSKRLTYEVDMLKGNKSQRLDANDM